MFICWKFKVYDFSVYVSNQFTVDNRFIRLKFKLKTERLQKKAIDHGLKQRNWKTTKLIVDGSFSRLKCTINK